MQIGDVDFDTAASDDYNFVFAGVADPGDVVHRVDQATGADAAGTHGLGESRSLRELERALRPAAAAAGRPRAERRPGRSAPR